MSALAKPFGRMREITMGFLPTLRLSEVSKLRHAAHFFTDYTTKHIDSSLDHILSFVVTDFLEGVGVSLSET